jgi:hypothetical protein
MEARAVIMAGRPLSQVATPITPLRVGSERISLVHSGKRKQFSRQFAL